MTAQPSRPSKKGTKVKVEVDKLPVQRRNPGGHHQSDGMDGEFFDVDAFWHRFYSTDMPKGRPALNTSFNKEIHVAKDKTKGKIKW